MEPGVTRTVAVIDYGMGNLTSVAKAFAALFAEVIVTSDPKALSNAERLVLPGVGAFGQGMDNLRRLGLVGALHREVIERRKPFLGICLGMELLARDSLEQGHHLGLGWLDATVRPLEPVGQTLKSIHIGWNDIRPRGECRLFTGLGTEPCFYFVHQYWLDCLDSDVVTATASYGRELVAAIQRENIFGVQFHPEKSQETGLALLRNFLHWQPDRGSC